MLLVKVTEVPAQIVVVAVLIVIVGVTLGLTVIVTLAVVGFGLAQATLLDIDTLTTSPLLSVEDEKVPLVLEAPAFTAFTNQV
jgi:hypothetical protein